jgi:pilus assembly protein FimV
MSRIPASAGVALVGLLPLCAAALGLGEIESRSYLNQPLAAEIPVFAEAAGEMAGLSVSLASPDTFAQYGLQRPAFLGNLSFAVTPNPRGGVIRITSAQPVTEPFLTLLLEVQWPQGRLLREYTVLLDPPAFTGGAVRQPVQAPAAAAPAPSAPPATASEAPATSRPAVPVAAADGSTHVVARNETLWGIANRYGPQGGADINQVMMAIYRANPEAFAGNINRLNAGAVLRLPDQAAISALGQSEADAEVRRQTSEWQATAAAPARLELVPPPAESTATAAPAASATAGAGQAADAEESRRLLAVKDAELQALRKRVADLEKQAGEVAVEQGPPAPAVQAETPPAQEAPAPEPEVEDGAPAAPAATEPAEPAKPVRARPSPSAASPAAESPGLIGTITQLFTSIWLWIAAAVVLVGGLLLARRRSAREEPARWQPTTGRGRGQDAAEATQARSEDMIVIEERPQATGGFERRATARGDEETLLEKTISTEGPVNLDQSDALAEAEFHVAYGLYDQAADILTAAIAREPSRRDLPLKLLDVYFGWENREGFLKEARALRERIGTEDDPDWKRVCIMGKQLCPGEALFAAAAAPGAEEMDLALGGEASGTVDMELGGADPGLDFDLSGMDVEAGADAPTRLSQTWGSAQTQEIPTIEAPGPDGASTMETPTVESPELSSTMETPTIQTRAAGRTMETPTIEAPGIGGTARLQGLSAGDEHHDQTAEIDLEELGLDLTGLDEAARDMATGLQETLPSGGDSGLDFDLSGGAIGSDGEESTAEMTGRPQAPLADDTAEQPGISSGDTMATQRLTATSDELESLDLDIDFSGTDAAGSDLTSTGIKAISGARHPEDQTMTEVGTKLDLARAYMDMGDPDGARSILNEVLEEGDQGQRQEARQLLDSLDNQ